MNTPDGEIEKCRGHVESLMRQKGNAGLQETSYPSRSLNFLNHLRNAPLRLDQPKNARSVSYTGNHLLEARIKLKILIAGAGIGGLAAAIALQRRGHTVYVFEKAPELGEVGAGIQVPPNSSRLLLRWGLGPYLEGKAIEPEKVCMRRWKTGELISLTKLRPDFKALYGAPYYVIHRANLQLAMHELALKLGVNVRVGAGVKLYDAESTKVVLENGEVHYADLVIAADGIKSEARRVVLGGKDEPPEQCGYAAYRAMVDVELMREDPEVSWLLKTPAQNLWVGDERHVMSYTIAGGKSFNMVLSHPEPLDPSVWNQNTVIEDMRKHFQGWDPRLVKVISMIRTTLKWPLLSGKPLRRWLSSSGNLLIIGDAAHAMVPYMSEGAAMAVEDGAALAEVLSLIQSPSEIRPALEVFERQRILRTGQMQEASLVNGKIWHFDDGPEQRARDYLMGLEADGHVSETPNQWGDPVTADWAYGYDAEFEIKKAWIGHQAGR